MWQLKSSWNKSLGTWVWAVLKSYLLFDSAVFFPWSQPWSELPNSVLTPQFCRAGGAEPALQDLSREPCTVLISLRALRRASWAPRLSRGQPCLLSFHWQVLCAPSQELLTHFIQCGPRKKKLLTKPAFITTLLSHASLFFLTNYEEQTWLNDL